MTIWPITQTVGGGLEVYRSDVPATQNIVANPINTFFPFPTPIKADITLSEDGLIGVGFVGQMAGVQSSPTGNATVGVLLDGVIIHLTTAGGLPTQQTLANALAPSFTTIRTSPTAGMNNGGALDVGPNVSPFAGLVVLLAPAGAHTIEVMGANNVLNAEAWVRNARLVVTSGSSVI